jgi:L-lysine 6-transaminase
MHEEAVQERLRRVATTKDSNADYYSTYMAEFVDTVERSCAPSSMPHYFFVDGGALAVENALKAAFDWKAQKNLAAGRPALGHKVLHLEHAFHGRSGYTLSVTNTDPVKTRHFPMFDWPRIRSPAIEFPLHAESLERATQAEQAALAEAERAFESAPHEIAAILLEPIQGEGGDRHFRAEFFRKLRHLADEREALLIYDEVQTGLGLTGKWWAYQHHGVEPDILCFAKKMQVGGIFASRRIDEVAGNVFAVSSRINSTWGASLVDMVRCTRILEVIVNEGLLESAAERGDQLLSGLQTLAAEHPELVTNPRGSGLMCAIDLPSPELRAEVIAKCFELQMIVLPCGPRSVRFRPTLTVKEDAIHEGILRLRQALKSVSTGPGATSAD